MLKSPKFSGKGNGDLCTSSLSEVEIVGIWNSLIDNQVGYFEFLYQSKYAVTGHVGKGIGFNCSFFICLNRSYVLYLLPFESMQWENHLWSFMGNSVIQARKNRITAVCIFILTLALLKISARKALLAFVILSSVIQLCLQSHGSVHHGAGWWHKFFDEFEQTPRDDGQRSLVSCSKWGRRVGQDSVAEQLIFLFCVSKGLPWWLSCKESTCIVGDLGSIPVLAWRRERLPTPVFWPGEFHSLSKVG